eukprot:TRINITY_DN3118_c0_g1_i4.p1 TRINITY_DN3118_c0_g1~~TRINITY_DN3118_c0_g1_i4.p1  ORF type:complete len:239 (-),score=33.33 TRINITY_DN3118_c0_g1_i4:37-753(-)
MTCVLSSVVQRASRRYFWAHLVSRTSLNNQRLFFSRKAMEDNFKIDEQFERIRRGEEKLQDPLIWVDLEMTGLDLEKNSIMEIAVLISDGQLVHILEGPEIAIHQSEEMLNNMNEWCIQHHGSSGLTQRCRESTISMEQAEEQVLAFLQKYTAAGVCPLAGNSVSVDRTFLQRYMPRVASHLHYRTVDVSTVKELCRRWFPQELAAAPRKVLAHTALSDIYESIKELRYYRTAVFKQN